VTFRARIVSWPSWTALLIAVCMSWPAVATARPRRPSIEELQARVVEVQRVVVAAERASTKSSEMTPAQMAKRLVAGEIELAESNYERAAIIFLDLVENYPEKPAGIQAKFHLADALTHLGMERWAYELFSENLADGRPDAKRLHQRSVARLFDLAAPRRAAGFAKRPGLSATPEVRARLEAVGLDAETRPPTGVVKAEDAARLVSWARSFPPEGREPQLRYSFGRYLFLSGDHAAARDELDSLSPFDIPLTRGGEGAQWRVRGAYVAAAASLALGEVEDALARFERVTKAKPSDPRDRQIVELSWMARGRILHDLDQPDDAVHAYRRVGRDSAFFPEALYETAWTLLAAKRYDQAVQALDLLLIYDPESPIVAEIKQLRGKVRIQQRDYKGAEEQFLALRREFDRVAKQLGGRLSSRGDATAYFSAVVGEDMENFSLDAVLPLRAVPVARTLPRAVQAEAIARDVGRLERDLAELEDVLERLQVAIEAPRKATLFTDLAAHGASLGNADADLLQIEEAVIDRVGLSVEGSGYDQLETERLRLRKKVDAPLGETGDAEADRVRALMLLEQRAHKLDLMVGEMRAQLVATERYYEHTRKDQKIDHQGFLSQAAEMRDSVAELERDATSVRRRIRRRRSAVRYDDARANARAAAIEPYRRHLDQMYSTLIKAAPSAEASAVWSDVQTLQERSGAAQEKLESAARSRLQDAVVVIQEETIKIAGYRQELDVMTVRTRDQASEVLTAVHADVSTELGNFVMRSEVGLLDVAWAMKEAETDEVHRLEVDRNRDLGELDDAVDKGLEALGQ
jgi:TolA-binding protein